jgi:hypothetical protein
VDHVPSSWFHATSHETRVTAAKPPSGSIPHRGLTAVEKPADLLDPKTYIAKDSCSLSENLVMALGKRNGVQSNADPAQSPHLRATRSATESLLAEAGFDALSKLCQPPRRAWTLVFP